MAVTTEQSALCLIIRTSSPSLGQLEVSAILKAIPGSQKVILDLGSVKQAQPDSFQPLIMAASQAKKLGSPFFLVASPDFHETLKLRGLDGLFRIHPSLTQALAQLEEGTTRIVLAMPKEVRFLLVDKTKSNRDLLKEQLTRLGLANISETDGTKAALQKMTVFHKTGDPVSFVFSEWELPEMNGLEFLRSLRSSAEFQDVPLILVTSNLDGNQVTVAEGLGVTECLARPIDPENLLRAINEGWRKHNPSAESEFWDI